MCLIGLIAFREIVGARFKPIIYCYAYLIEPIKAFYNLRFYK